ncbi:hypothetical protein HMPREF2738_00318 [Clostridiales bacterium KLE1615]|nr:hypothetical protein HMPREF2738_00318 [Clostridiales bacterium KLE1615]
MISLLFFVDKNSFLYCTPYHIAHQKTMSNFIFFLCFFDE